MAASNACSDDATARAMTRIDEEINRLNAEKQRLATETVYVPKYEDFLQAKPLWDIDFCERPNCKGGLSWEFQHRTHAKANTMLIPDVLGPKAPEGSVAHLMKRLIAHSLCVKYGTNGDFLSEYAHVRGTLINTIKHVAMLSEMLVAERLSREFVFTSFEMLFCIIFDNCYNTTKFNHRHSTILPMLNVVGSSVEQLIVFWFDYLSYLKGLDLAALGSARIFRLDLAIDHFSKKLFMKRFFHRTDSPYDPSQHRELHVKLDGEQTEKEAVMGFASSSPTCPFRQHG